MRNSWGFRGAQRSSFSHCAHGPPVAGWWGFSFSPETSPEEGRVPPIQQEQGPACLLDYVYEMWVVGSQPATFCTLQKMSSHLKLHLPSQSGASAGRSVPSPLIKMLHIHTDECQAGTSARKCPHTGEKHKAWANIHTLTAKIIKICKLF